MCRQLRLLYMLKKNRKRKLKHKIDAHNKFSIARVVTVITITTIVLYHKSKAKPKKLRSMIIRCRHPQPKNIYLKAL